MAVAKRIVTVFEPLTVTLELTEREAKIIKTVIGQISGTHSVTGVAASSDGSPIMSIYKALDNVSVIADSTVLNGFKIGSHKFYDR